MFEQFMTKAASDEGGVKAFVSRRIFTGQDRTRLDRRDSCSLTSALAKITKLPNEEVVGDGFFYQGIFRQAVLVSLHR